MGYFSNGSEGIDFHVNYCSRCLHDTRENCPVWTLHLIYNGDQFPEQAKTDLERGKAEATRNFLDTMIARKENGTNECQFFTATDEPAKPMYSRDVIPSMRQWAKDRGIIREV